MELGNIITENDFQIIGNSFQSSENLKRKSILGMEEVSGCKVGHMLEFMGDYKYHNGSDPTLYECIKELTTLTESLSLSHKGTGLKYMLGAFVRQIKVKDSKMDKEDKE